MARKSRRNVNREKLEIQQNELAVIDQPLLPSAAYIRLSNMDEDEDSIRTQMILVHDFINKHNELQLTDTYVDNGFTGTNFDRPEFERMMQDVRSGRIQCIVVKDLSRFGRDYLETGYYLETIFPRLNVRFIAVTDDFDNTRSDDMANISVSIKNIVNNYYAKDISKKLSSSYEARRKRGDLINGGTSPYGYNIDRKRKAYVVDENTACYVRMMFQWYLMGVSTKKIAERLDLIQAPYRSEVRRTGKYEKQHRIEKKWLSDSVWAILSNLAYTGDLAAGKTKSAMYKGMKQTRTDPKEWTIKRDDHPALVPRSDFDAVQKILKERKRKGKPRMENSLLPDNPFSGIIYCGCCGHHMSYFKKISDNEPPYGYFYCKTKQTDSSCGNHTISERLLEILVMDQINILIQTACDKKQLAKSVLDANGDNPSLTSLQKRISALSGQITRTEERETNLYEDYTNGLLDKEEYQYMKEHYIKEKQEMESKLQKLKEKMHTLKKKAETCMILSERLEQYTDTHVFNEKLVRGLVEKISVGMDNTLDITFKCNDVFQDFIDFSEELDHEE